MVSSNRVHESHVYTVGFSGDSGHLVSGGDDGMCYLLDPSSDHVGDQAAATQDPTVLWTDLAAGGPSAYRAMNAMKCTPDATVKLILRDWRQ